MSRFLNKLTIFFIVLIILAIPVDIITSKGLLKSNHKDFSEWGIIKQGNIDADLIILGSSRAWNHFSPAVMDSILNLDSYNLGNDDYDFLMQQYKYQFYNIYNKIPEYIILSLDNHTLSKRSGMFKKHQYLPLILNPCIRDLVKTYQAYNKAELNLPLIRYANNIEYFKIGIAHFLNSPQTKIIRYKGYMASTDVWDGKISAELQHNKISFNTDSILLTEFTNFIQTQVSKGIKIIMVYSPVHIKGQNIIADLKKKETLYQSIAKKYQVPFYNYLADSLCYNQSSFCNAQHLNAAGADYFSKKLSNQLKSYLLQ